MNDINRGFSLLFIAWASILSALADETQLKTNSIAMKLVPVAPGTFTMGQDGPAAD